MAIVKESCYFGLATEGVLTCSNFSGCTTASIYLLGSQARVGAVQWVCLDNKELHSHLYWYQGWLVSPQQIIIQAQVFYWKMLYPWNSYKTTSKNWVPYFPYSQVRILVTSFSCFFMLFLFKQHVSICLYDKKKLAWWLENMNFIFRL